MDCFIVQNIAVSIILKRILKI